MFSDDELDCIERYANNYRRSTSRYSRDSALRCITLKLQSKMTDLSFRTMACMLTARHPSVDLSDIVTAEGGIGSNFTPQSSGFDRSYISPLETSTTNRYIPPTLPYASPCTRTDEIGLRLRELEKRSRNLNASLYNYAQPNNDRREEAENMTVTDRVRQAIKVGDTTRNDTLQGIRNGLLAGSDAVEDTSWMNTAERDCYKILSEEERHNVLASYKRMKAVEPDLDNPLRIRILMSQIPDQKKLEIFTRLEQQISSVGEGPKYTAWITSLLKVPFGVHTTLPCGPDDPDDVHKFLTNARNTFDSEIYGHAKVKDEFIAILGSWIKLGSSCGQGNVIGLTGPVGVGKTSLAKSLATVLGRPIYFISLGGSCYSSMLNGHSYTYEGASYGEIARATMESRCMDPVFFFDELDKVSSNDRGEEIIHMLIHLTDPTQNNGFVDRYFAGIPLDMSKALFVFSYNNKEKVNPILRDRIHEICLKDFEQNEKAVIANDYIIPSICSEMKLTNFIFADGALDHLVAICNKSTGLRLLKAILIRLLRIVVVASMTDGQTVPSLGDITFSDSFEVTKDIVDMVFVNHQEGQVEENPPPPHMYM